MVDVVKPLVVDLGGEFVNAFNVVGGFLVSLFVVEEPGACAVGELAQEVLSCVGGTWGLVVGV